MIAIDPILDPTLAELRAVVDKSRSINRRSAVPSMVPEPVDQRMVRMANNLFDALREVNPEHVLVQEYQQVWWRQP